MLCECTWRMFIWFLKRIKQTPVNLTEASDFNWPTFIFSDGDSLFRFLKLWKGTTDQVNKYI